MRNLVPPCEAACPAFTDVQGYVACLALGRFAEAYDVARLTNPFATSCGYICFHPCEQECRRGKVDDAISIMELKRAAATFGSKDSSPPRGEGKGEGAKKVAVIGAGPAGLTAAQDLVAAGYAVTVYERENRAGGMLRLTVPAYRLPDEALDRDIALIEAAGVTVEYGRELGRDFDLEGLKKDYDAVVVAAGLPLSRSLPVFPAAGDDILLAIPFLRAVKEGNPPALKDNVIVVGGGNVAIDVARTAVRLGKRVELVCLEARDEMPAHDWEIEEAAEEGVKMNCCLGPAEVLSGPDALSGLRCQAVASVFNAEGRFDPTFIEDEFKEIGGDTIIVAIGQSRDTSALSSAEVDLAQLAEAGVFAAGEFAEGPGSAIQAVQSGHLAAGRVHDFLSGKPAMEPSPEILPELTDRVKPLVPARDRVKATPRRPDERVKDFGLFEPGLSARAAVREAARCMACLSGALVDSEKCIACLTCVRVCPFEIPLIGKENVAVIDSVECQACGLCVTECPAAAITLTRGQAERLFEDIARAAATGTVEFTCINSLPEDDVIDKPGRVPVLCAAQIGEVAIFKALEAGADTVTVAMCSDDTCFYKGAPDRLRARVASVKETLAGLGLDPDAVRIKE